ncbi:hypothetical protein [Sphingomonas sp. 37zxx]|uniref:hypothetical protein n=1 Tax=Sphingomonas sp. 37zxx TaxID=1550073 RepID=UPI00053BDEAA|nr:hypothetical protein [Sphingomonas sp. 37zxx]
MRMLARILVGGVGAFNFALGLVFLFAPGRLAQSFSIVPIGAQGMATMRADFSAFFLCGAVFALVGAWRLQRAPLLVPLLLLGTALSGRIVSIIIDGFVATTLEPMLIEAAMIAILLLAYRQFAPNARDV